MYAMEAPMPLPQRTGAKSEISSPLQTGRVRGPSPIHACSIFMSCGTFSTTSELAACPAGQPPDARSAGDSRPASFSSATGRLRALQGYQPLSKALPARCNGAGKLRSKCEGGACFSCRGVIPSLDPQFRLDKSDTFTRVGLHCRRSIPKRDRMLAPFGVCKQEVYL
jgi:hypothetical protein